jgi:TonB family protein
MRRSLLLAVLIIGFALSWLSSALAESRAKCIALYAPKPDYPSLVNGQKPEGEGLFVCHIDVITGIVRSVSVAKSTGFAVLDKAAVDCFKRWKFKPCSCAPDIKIPLRFWHHLPPTFIEWGPHGAGN